LKAFLLSAASQEREHTNKAVEKKSKQEKKSEFEAKIPKYQPIFK